jgi:hypothetical protein
LSASNEKLSDIIADVDEGRLTVRPFFQRRLVWTNADKESLIDTVLQDYPFPEIFMATGTLDLKSSKRVKWLVDGQQRITTLQAYVHGTTDLLYKKIPRFEQLTPEAQTNFYDYDVAVRDLGTISEDVIREIFRRINSTDYALKSMEILNAMFSGEYKRYCEALSRSLFFEAHGTFSSANRKRMYDITFCVILVTTLLSGYYRRDELNAQYLERYNDEFKPLDAIQTGLDRVFDFIDSCGFAPRSRVWKQTDLFTLMVELYSALVSRGEKLDAKDVGTVLQPFYDEVDDLFASAGAVDASSHGAEVMRYLKAATKATNDKYARVERAEVISALIASAQTKHSGLKLLVSASGGAAYKQPQRRTKSPVSRPMTALAQSAKKVRKSRQKKRMPRARRA